MVLQVKLVPFFLKKGALSQAPSKIFFKILPRALKPYASPTLFWRNFSRGKQDVILGYVIAGLTIPLSPDWLPGDFG